ncbi:hypothetical protein IF1G_00738 [Cordyceps javanica]|uniref:Uncharacterized protein n=1 Tax=Cordyceps javanica TaxID=43265 RepID=A0A545VGG0_9HYPO|nr:hypothetical protein IF1G_00738 [Cordyceps javanica]
MSVAMSWHLPSSAGHVSLSGTQRDLRVGDFLAVSLVSTQVRAVCDTCTSASQAKVEL